MATKFKLPELGENIGTGNVVKVLVKVGDVINKDQPVIELETGKAAIEVPSMVAGKIQEINVQEGDTIKVGQTVLTIQEKKSEIQEKEEPEKEQTRPEKEETRGEADKGTRPFKVVQRSKPEPAQAKMRHAAPAAPSVRRLAREIGIDINKVPAQGRGGAFPWRTSKPSQRQPIKIRGSLHLRLGYSLPLFPISAGGEKSSARQ